MKTACFICRFGQYLQGDRVQCEKLGNVEVRQECVLQEIPMLPELPTEEETVCESAEQTR